MAKRNDRNETTETKQAKPPKQPKQNDSNDQNEREEKSRGLNESRGKFRFYFRSSVAFKAFKY